MEIAAGPRRAPDSGSASTGQPLAAANASAAAGSRSAPQPATSTPLGLARTASARPATSPGAADRTPAGAAVQGAPPARPAAGSPPSRGGPSAADGPSGTSGSAKARLRWTGPAGGPVASAQARLARDRQYRPAPGSSPGTPTSQNHRTADPYSFSWSVAWLAPVPRSSGGRSAVSTSSGTLARSASSTAGWKLAAAVPEVHSTTTARPDRLAAPSAKNAADRSSRWTCTLIPGCSANASANGADRDPGARQASVTPALASSSTSVRANRRPAPLTLGSRHDRPPQPPPPHHRGGPPAGTRPTRSGHGPPTRSGARSPGGGA